MAWTAPRSWTPGELVTATMMQAQVSDNLNALSTQAWTWSANQTYSADVYISALTKLYLDNGVNSYMFESGVDTFDFVLGGAFTMVLNTTGIFSKTLQTTGSAANLFVNTGNTYFFRSTSSVRYKKDITDVPLSEAQRIISGLRPINYYGKTDEDKRQQIGFIAEEVSQIDPLLVQWSEHELKGREEYVTYDRIPVYLVPVVQDLMARVAQLEGRVH